MIPGAGTLDPRLHLLSFTASVPIGLPSVTRRVRKEMKPSEPQVK